MSAVAKIPVRLNVVIIVAQLAAIAFCCAAAARVRHGWELAGLVASKDSSFAQAAVRFAAKSESIAKLTDEERAALESFVVELTSRG